MKNDWVITRWDGNRGSHVGSAPGSLSEAEIVVLLQRLACRDLTPEEIIASSRKVNDQGYASHLERVGSGNPISVGNNPHYTANRPS